MTQGMAQDMAQDMAQGMAQGMANADEARDADRVWELMQKIGYAMLVTRDGDKLCGRAMTACIERNRTVAM